jgi:hypothetical protein
MNLNAAIAEIDADEKFEERLKTNDDDAYNAKIEELKMIKEKMKDMVRYKIAYNTNDAQSISELSQDRKTEKDAAVIVDKDVAI